MNSAGSTVHMAQSHSGLQLLLTQEPTTPSPGSAGPKLKCSHLPRLPCLLFLLSRVLSLILKSKNPTYASRPHPHKGHLLHKSYLYFLSPKQPLKVLTSAAPVPNQRHLRLGPVCIWQLPQSHVQ